MRDDFAQLQMDFPTCRQMTASLSHCRHIARQHLHSEAAGELILVVYQGGASMRAGIFLAAVITLNAGFARATETGWPRIPPTKSAVQSPLSKPAPVEAAAPSAPDRI